MGKNKKNYKFLIDTGSNKSFIDSEIIADKSDIKIINSIKLKTALDTHIINKQIILKGLKEFKTNEHLQFLIFKFHNYFDGLIGSEIMKKLGVRLDFKNSILETDDVKIKILYKPNLISKVYKVSSNSKILCNLPVDVKEGDIYVETNNINLIISEGLYTCKNWYAIVEVINESNEPIEFSVEEPLKVKLVEKEFYEFNNYNIINDFENKTDKSEIKDLLRISHMNEEEKEEIIKLCTQYSDIFQRENNKLTFTNEIKHSIKTKDDIPIYTKSYRYPVVHKEEVRNQINKMLEQGIVRPSYSPWSSPIWIVPKKLDASGKQKWRLVVDYRKLNEKTIDDKYPLPNIDEILDKLGKCQYFSTLDLASGFHQIEVNPDDIQKTAFTVDYGHYEYVRMPFGLKNAPSTFQRVMDHVLRDLIGKNCLCYMDDIIVFSTSLQEHIESLGKVFQKLRNSNLKIQLDKSEFLRKEVTFLGHLITPDGVKPNPLKLKAIKDFPIPKTVKQIKSFLGLVGYYRKFIKDFADITKPLTECLKKDKTINITERYIQCIKICKDILMNDPLLQYPDFTKPFNLTTDASNFALGAILSQGPIGSDKPIAYASRTLNEHEQNYSTIEKELLAIVWATKYFRPYIYGTKFKIITDHKPLTWLFSLKEPNSKLIRWRLKLEEFDYELIYKKGKINTNADALSRVEININNEMNHNEINDEIERMSMINNVDEIDTIHSADENLSKGIPISERNLNEFTYQLILRKQDNIKKITKEVISLFKSKKRTIITNNNFDDKDIVQIMRSLIRERKTLAILTDDDTFLKIQNLFNKYFDNKNYKLVRCNKLIEDITEKDKQEEIIRNYHNKSNHRGINETNEHLKREYYFPNMKELITKIINNCEICSKYKYERTVKKLKYELSETPDKPLDILHIDIYFVNKQHFLTIVDKFSRFGASYILNNRNSLNIIQVLKHYISQHGIPKKIIADNGNEFSSTIFKEFLNLYDIEIHYTTAKTHTGNSTVERFHSTLTEIIRIIYNENKNKPIQEIMDEALITYNNSVHSVTKLTPFELISGHYNLKSPIPNLDQINTNHDYLNNLRDSYSKLCNIIKDRNLRYKQNVINKLNENREDPPNFKQNDIIYEADDRRNKLAPQFIKHKVFNNNKITINTDKRKVHKKRIKNKRKFTD